MMTRRSHRSATRPASGKLKARTIEPGKRTSPAWAGVYSSNRCMRITSRKVLAAKVMKNKIMIPETAANVLLV
jgi:hypothetical protein